MLFYFIRIRLLSLLYSSVLKKIKIKLRNKAKETIYCLYQQAAVAVLLPRICPLCIIFAFTIHIFCFGVCLLAASLLRLWALLCMALFPSHESYVT